MKTNVQWQKFPNYTEHTPAWKKSRIYSLGKLAVLDDFLDRYVLRKTNCDHAKMQFSLTPTPPSPLTPANNTHTQINTTGWSAWIKCMAKSYISTAHGCCGFFFSNQKEGVEKGLKNFFSIYTSLAIDSASITLKR